MYGHPTYLPVQVVVGAQADLGQVLAALVLGQLLVAAGQGQQIADGQALEPGRLLKAVADAQPRPLGDAETGDVLSVPDDLALGGRYQTHDDLRQCLS